MLGGNQIGGMLPLVGDDERNSVRRDRNPSGPCIWPVKTQGEITSSNSDRTSVRLVLIVFR